MLMYCALGRNVKDRIRKQHVRRSETRTIIMAGCIEKQEREKKMGILALYFIER